ELVTFRVSAHGRVPKPALQPQKPGGRSDDARRGERPVHCDGTGAPLPTAVYRGEGLRAGTEITGPAILEYPGTTVVIGPGQTGRVDQWLNVVINPEGKP